MVQSSLHKKFQKNSKMTSSNILVGENLNLNTQSDQQQDSSHYSNLTFLKAQIPHQNIKTQSNNVPQISHQIDGNYYILADYIIQDKEKAYQLAQTYQLNTQQSFAYRNNQRVAEFSSSDGEEVIIQKKQRKIEKFKWNKQKQIKFQLICLLIGYEQVTPKRIVQYMNDPNINNQVAGSHIQKFKKMLMKQENVQNWTDIDNSIYLIKLETDQIKNISKMWLKPDFQGWTEKQIIEQLNK